MKDEKEINLDILKHLENLSNQINGKMAPKTKTVFRRYPVTLGLLILIGAITLNEGLKGLLRKFGIFEIDPLYLTLFGLAILTITGTLYKKLDK